VRVRIPAAVQPFDPVQIGPFKVVGRLGAGAMGQVYLARSPSSRLVAVKTIRPDMAMDEDYRRRFAREVTAARRVSGAFTAAVVDSDPDADLPWLATVYLPAPSLAALVEAYGPLPVPAIRWLAAGCAEALENIHEAGLVHRDLKPSNVLVAADGPKVIDFGLARADGLSHLTGSGGVMGTPSFMSPEQAGGKAVVGTAADVYSLGATLLFAATGRSPYGAMGGAEAILMMLAGKPDLTDVPDGLRAMLTGCLASDPMDRPTPAALVEYHAPYLAGAEDPPPLPTAALKLIDEYSRSSYSQALSPEQEDQDWDAELDRFLDRRPAHPSLAPGYESAFDTRRHPIRRSRQAGLIGVGVVLVVAGVAGGLFYGSHQIGSAGAAPLPVVASNAALGALSTAEPAGPPPSGEPIGPPPSGQPGGQQGPPPGGPPPGAFWVSGATFVAVAPPYGTPDTAFVLHGNGWPVGTTLTVSVVGGRTSTIRPVVDSSGDFTYTMNQVDEYFTGPIQPGTYSIQVTDGKIVATVYVQVGS